MHAFQVPETLPQWVEASLAGKRNILATSNQGIVLLFREAGMEFVVKTAMGPWPLINLRRATLRREAEAYRRMEGLTGVPRCHGLVDGRYLVLEYISGTPYREAEIADREAWFDRLLEIIRGFHQRGVAHGDLKKKSNLIVTDSGRPCVIDFGATVLNRDGFHPLRRRLFQWVAQTDLNAWVKHKYHGRYEDATEADRELLHLSRPERWLRDRRARRWQRQQRRGRGD
jgi:predicted Ser/Thr protein kinase